MDINRYAYAGNDPVNGSDPTGHIREDPNKFPGGDKGEKHNRGSNDGTTEQGSKPANETKDNCAGCKKVAGDVWPNADEEKALRRAQRNMARGVPGPADIQARVRNGQMSREGAQMYDKM